MNKRQFFEKVALMRESQKEYFRTRSHDVLRKSKALEAEIDAEIKRVRDLGYTEPQQPNLFSPTT
nr:MAG TPA: CREB-regulated transcription coactivator 2-helix, CREB binding, CREB, PROTEIN.0A [Caudoviricetes sp.]